MFSSKLSTSLGLRLDVSLERSDVAQQRELENASSEGTPSHACKHTSRARRCRCPGVSHNG
eukprot:5242253-Pyramimonas_sp.AAC.1